MGNERLVSEKKEKQLVNAIFYSLKDLSNDPRFRDEINGNYNKLENATKKALHELFLCW